MAATPAIVERGTTAPVPAGAMPRRRWLGTLYQWHWISSALCLVGMLLFALTGITLNHPDAITARPQVENRTLELPPALLADLEGRSEGDLPAALAAALEARLGIRLQGQPEWSEDELYLSLPRPGGDAWLSIDRASGAVEYERTDRGWIAYFNDLHKARHTGLAWTLFVDLFALACIVFSVTGLLLLARHARSRPSTWPLVAFGFVLPLLTLLLFLH